MTNGAIRIAPFGDDFTDEKGFFYSFNVPIGRYRIQVTVGDIPIRKYANAIRRPSMAVDYRPWEN